MKDIKHQNIDHQSYFYVIPAQLAESGKATKSLLYGLIVSLSNKEGYCWATNKFLAQKLNKKEWTIKNYLTELEKEGWIKRKIKQRTKRKIYFLFGGGGGKITQGWVKNHPGVGEKSPRGMTSKSVKNPVDKETNGIEVEPSNINSNINKYEFFKKILKRNNKKPYFLNMRVVDKGGKKWCIPNDGSPWLEYAGTLSELEWR